MAANNITTIAGRVGKLEMHATTRGKDIATLSIAVDAYKGRDDKGKSRYETEWYDLTVYEEKLKFIKATARKGNVVSATCHLKPYKYQKDGKTISGLNIILDDLAVLAWSKRNDDEDTGSRRESSEDNDDEEFPF